ncbi:MAG: transporter substrate-binding domain-containing protein [Bacteroidetes bacterium]|nr:transporter substrate-binding domain-containing protein [Bacteroidota bacterium]
MKRITIIRTITILILSGITMIPACKNNKQTEDNVAKDNLLIQQKSESKIDLPEIKKRGKLIAITTYSPTSYFLYRGQPMGFEYELLNQLADYLVLELDIVIAEDLDQITSDLFAGKGDIIAHALAVTKQRKKYIAFTEYYTLTKQVLVQRKPGNWQQLKQHEIDNKLIRNPIDLIGKTIHVRKNSSYHQRIRNLSDEVGDEIKIEYVPGSKETSEIIQMVSEGVINYTVADQNIAENNATYFTNLDVKTAVSLPQRLAWAVRKSSPELRKKVNKWILQVRGSKEYNIIYNKYFRNKKRYRALIKSELFSKTGGKISKYDDLIRENAVKLDWDWRLLASQIYQESEFDAKAKSWAGGTGLMQVMPSTGKEFGITNLYDPKQNILAGTRYLEYLNNFWKEIPDSSEKIRFILASFNAGQNHISDARKLTEKYGKDPNIWQGNVDEYLLKLSKRQYFIDPVVKFGYCRGSEPYKYVNEIFERYEHYMKLISEKPEERE